MKSSSTCQMSPNLPCFLLSAGAKLLTPVPDRFVGDKDSSLREQVFCVSKAQGEPVVQPNGMTDDFRRKTVTPIE